jgi:hypothetical protein
MEDGMTDSFAVHLGGGTYLDASGKIVVGPPSAAQIYKIPDGFRLDTKKIQDIFKDLSGILPSSDEDKKKWAEWGVPTALVDFLGSVAGVAGIVGTAVSVYAWVIGVMLTIMDSLMEDEGLSPELAKALFSIKSQVQGLEQIAMADKMIQMHSEFDGRIDRMRGLLTRLAIEKPNGAARAQIFSEMRTIIDELAQPLSRLRNQDWSVNYDPDAYSGRAFAASILYIQDGSHLNSIPMYPPNLTVFDYRLGVPMLLYGATTFAALSRIAMPWFRSAGMYAGQLRKTAEAIDRFVLRMQNECLSCTEHTHETLYGLQDPLTAINAPGIPLPPPDLNQPRKTTYAVGAFDLVRYNDAFLVERLLAQWAAGADRSQRGLFNYDWYPPVADRDDLQAVAIAANEQAQQDYANMQVATGMFRLITTAAWLRFLSTPPDRSETVSGTPADSRAFHDQQPATATSPSIFPVGVIDHPATLKRYQAQSRIRVTTQEPGYVPAFRYKIVLRTIESLFGNEGWESRSYVGDVWRAEYEPTQGDPRCKRLRTELRKNSILSEIVLYEGPSNLQPVLLSDDEVTIRAATFDWYAPVVSPWSSYADAVEESVSPNTGAGGKKMMVGSGGVSIHLRGNQSPRPPSVPFIGDPSPLVSSIVDEIVSFGDYTTLTDASLEKAERRHVKIENVTVRWKLNWTADKLEVRIFGKPEDRPFQVHLVIEETVYSGATPPDDIGDVLVEQQFREQIHTPFVGEIVNQIVFVPEEFFAEESKAIERASKMLDHYARRFAEQRPIGPGDPIEFLQKSVRESITRSPSTATLAATLDMRVEFARRYGPELWDQVLMEAEGSTASS